MRTRILVPAMLAGLLAACGGEPLSGLCARPEAARALHAEFLAELDRQLAELQLAPRARPVRSSLAVDIAAPRVSGSDPGDGSVQCEAQLVVGMPPAAMHAFSRNGGLVGALGSDSLVVGSDGMRGKLHYRVRAAADEGVRVEAVEGHRPLADGVALAAVLGGFDDLSVAR